ncbi:MAG TPA: CHAD domain-containing protein [Fimbriimonadaceae bacterium]|nr:CHAD domain-containing protein [Fimbriimonadaceae bacterium]
MDGTIGGMAYRVLEAHRSRFESYRDAAYGGEEPEAIHQMRVNARRLRTLMRALAPVLAAPVLELEPELQWIATSLGEVRDIDVQSEAMPDLAGVLADLRVARLDQLRHDLDSPRYANLVQALRCRIEVGAHDDPLLASSPVLAVAPDVVGRAYRSVRRIASGIGEASEPEAIHTLRKRAKRLRYTADCFAELYGKPAKRFIGSLKELQDLLGAHQDAIVAQAFCAELRGRGPDVDPLAQRAADSAQALREKLPAALDDLAAQWPRLKRRMNRKRRDLWKPPVAARRASPL